MLGELRACSDYTIYRWLKKDYHLKLLKPTSRSQRVVFKTHVATVLIMDSFVTSRFRFSIRPVQVRELTLYTLLRLTPYIVILVLGLSLWIITKGGARDREIICFGNVQIITKENNKIPRLLIFKLSTKLLTNKTSKI